MNDIRHHRLSPSENFGGRALEKMSDQRSMARARCSRGFRHPDNDAKERGELVRSRPISADGHDRVPASSSRDRSCRLGQLNEQLIQTSIRMECVGATESMTAAQLVIVPLIKTNELTALMMPSGVNTKL
jgi:hypothetical protein